MQQIFTRFTIRLMVAIGIVGSLAAAAYSILFVHHPLSFLSGSSASSLALNSDSTMCSVSDNKKGSVLFIGCGGFF